MNAHTPINQMNDLYRNTLLNVAEIARHGAKLKASVQGKPYASPVEEFIDTSLALAARQWLQILEMENKPGRLQRSEFCERGGQQSECLEAYWRRRQPSQAHKTSKQLDAAAYQGDALTVLITEYTLDYSHLVFDPQEAEPEDSGDSLPF